jgi:hypothetical protein
LSYKGLPPRKNGQASLDIPHGPLINKRVYKPARFFGDNANKTAISIADGFFELRN